MRGISPEMIVKERRREKVWIVARETGKTSLLTIVRSRDELQGLTLLWDKKPIVRTEPRSILRISPWVVVVSSQAYISTY